MLPTRERQPSCRAAGRILPECLLGGSRPQRTRCELATARRGQPLGIGRAPRGRERAFRTCQVATCARARRDIVGIVVPLRQGCVLTAGIIFPNYRKLLEPLNRESTPRLLIPHHVFPVTVGPISAHDSFILPPTLMGPSDRRQDCFGPMQAWSVVLSKLTSP